MPGNANALTTRPALGVARFDVTLLSPGSALDDLVRGIAARFLAAGHTAAVVTAPAGDGPAPDTTLLDDSRACVVVVPEREAIGGAWFWWLVGRAGVAARRQAILPVTRSDAYRPPTSFRPRIPTPLATLPYLGHARAVGETLDSFWVVPPGQPMDSREAVNFEFWLHER